MPLRSYKPTSPGLRRMTRSTFEEITTDEPHKPLLEPQTRGVRPQQRGPAHGPPSRRRREAALPPDRLQARQARRAGPARDDRVRPEPLGAHRPAPLPRRREALHAPAARPEGRRRRRRRPGGRGARRQRPADREHPARHHDPQHRARPRQGRPDRPLGRRGGAAAGQGRRLRPGPPAVGRGAPGQHPLHGHRRPGRATSTTRTRTSARPAAPATWASGRRSAASS